MYLTPEKLIEQLVTEGGVIVCTGDCSEMEIAVAAACGRMAVNADSIGFVRRPKEWLAVAKKREEAHPNIDGRFSSSPNTKVTQ